MLKYRTIRMIKQKAARLGSVISDFLMPLSTSPISCFISHITQASSFPNTQSISSVHPMEHRNINVIFASKAGFCAPPFPVTPHF